MGEWPDWTKFPWWQLAVIAGVYAWLLRLALKTSDQLFTDPLADKLASLVRRAARALVELVTPPKATRPYVVETEGHAAGSAVVTGHGAYVLRAATGHYELGGSDASFRHSRIISAGPMTAASTGIRPA